MDQETHLILLTCLGYASVATKTERLARVSADEWKQVVTLARQHGVSQLLYHCLKPLAVTLPGQMAGELKRDYLVLAHRNICLYQALSKLLRLLREKNIAVIVLKGAYLAEAVYDNIGLRGMGDIDLLVRKGDLKRIEQELLALGGVPEDCNRVIAHDNHHFAYRLLDIGIRVEFHWTLHAMDSVQKDIDGLWSRAQSVTGAQTQIQALSPEDLLLHLCLHMAQHAHEMNIRMLCDISEVVRRYGATLDWQEVGTRARQWGVHRAVYVILRLARELLMVIVSADWLASLRQDDFNECCRDLMREQIFAYSALQGHMIRSPAVARLWYLKDPGSKLALLRERLLLSREVMALMYPAPANSWRIYLYYPVRIRDVLRRHGATFWRLIHGNSQTYAAVEHANQVAALRDWLMSGL
jgi:hypothetical protein